MDILMIVVIALHAMSGVFWAGSTAAMANLGPLSAPNAGRIFPGQMIAAGIVVVTGITLWAVWRGGALGTSEIILLVGIACAFVAAAIQGIVVGRARHAGAIAPASQPRVVTAYRITAGLLMLTVITMVTSKFF
jgi:hypothetical protein